MKTISTGRILNAVILGIIGTMCIYPFYYLLIYSLSIPKLALGGIYLWPRGLTLANYITVLTQNNIIYASFISGARTVVGTVVTVFCSSMFAYGLSKKSLPGKKIIYKMTLYTMYINAGLIPWYITMKALMLKNNFLLYILPYAVGAFFVILLKTYFEQLPVVLEESAMLDGANQFTIYLRIILPLSKPILATVALFAAVNQWNSWVDNFYLCPTPKLMTLQLLLLNFLTEFSSNQNALLFNTNNTAVHVTPTSIRMTITMIAVIPVFLIYPFLQKYFIKGIMLGAVKG